MDFFISLLKGLVNGLSSGATYAIIAIGYTMVYGIAKMLNFAHGDVIMVACYTIVLTVSVLVDPLIGVAVAVLLAVLVCTMLGIVIEKTAYKPLRGAPSLSVLITAIGISYLLQSLAQLLFGTADRPPKTAHIRGTLSFGEFSIDYNTLLTIAIATVLMIALTVFVKYSRVGRAMVAVSEDRDAARLMGINTDAIITLTFAIGSALAAIAGWLMLSKGVYTTNTIGAMPGIKAFSAAVIGGIGSIPGAMVGGIFLGLIEGVANSITMLDASGNIITPLAPYVDAIEFSILILVLLVRPAGLLGKARREKV